MHSTIIAHANELGHFPTLEQADAIWKQWNLFMAQYQVEDAQSCGLVGKELYDRSMRESIEKVMGK
jgi:hypothetical protein